MWSAPRPISGGRTRSRALSYAATSAAGRLPSRPPTWRPPFAAIPADGVYAGWLTAFDSDRPELARWPAAISVGSKPTFDGTERAVEAYALDRNDLTCTARTSRWISRPSSARWSDSTRPTIWSLRCIVTSAQPGPRQSKPKGAAPPRLPRRVLRDRDDPRIGRGRATGVERDRDELLAFDQARWVNAEAAQVSDDAGVVVVKRDRAADLVVKNCMLGH